MHKALVAFGWVIACLLAGFLMEKGRVSVLLHPLIPLVIMVTLSVATALWALYPKAARMAARHPEWGPAAARTGQAVWKAAERLSWVAGGLASLLGLFITAGYLNMPIDVVGRKVAASSMGIVVGLLQGAFCRMMLARCDLVLARERGIK